LPANVVPLPNDHDEIERLLSRLETCTHEFSHAVDTLKKSFAPRPRLLQTPSSHPNGVQKQKHHRAREAKSSVRRTHYSSSKSPRPKNSMSSPTERSLLHQALINL
jgi:hypothetical protein